MLKGNYKKIYSYLLGYSEGSLEDTLESSSGCLFNRVPIADNEVRGRLFTVFLQFILFLNLINILPFYETIWNKIFLRREALVKHYIT